MKINNNNICSQIQVRDGRECIISRFHNDSYEISAVITKNWYYRVEFLSLSYDISEGKYLIRGMGMIEKYTCPPSIWDYINALLRQFPEVAIPFAWNCAFWAKIHAYADAAAYAYAAAADAAYAAAYAYAAAADAAYAAAADAAYAYAAAYAYDAADAADAAADAAAADEGMRQLEFLKKQIRRIKSKKRTY